MRGSASNACHLAATLLAAGLLWTSGAAADTVTFSGVVAYTGRYAAPALYVAVLDPAGVDGPTVLVRHGYQAGEAPLVIPYSLSFDNTGVSPQLAVAAFLDVDGGGGDSVSGADILGWYGSSAVPTFVSSATSLTDLDFALPYAEIHGTLAFAPGQSEARVELSPDGHCVVGGFRPRDPFSSSGAYGILGIYPGTYCIRAVGNGPGGGWIVCNGDPTCESPVTVTIGTYDVKTDIDFAFTSLSPVEPTTWGLLKSRY